VTNWDLRVINRDEGETTERRKKKRNWEHLEKKKCGVEKRGKKSQKKKGVLKHAPLRQTWPNHRAPVGVVGGGGGYPAKGKNPP